MMPVIAMGVVAVLYVLVRPLLVGVVPHLSILEFPVGMVVVGGLLYGALHNPTPPPPPVRWRRHQQVVRPLPDPVLRPMADAVEAWIATGASPQEAARVLARGLSRDAAERERLQAELAQKMTVTSSRRGREALLREVLPDPNSTGA